MTKIAEAPLITSAPRPALGQVAHHDVIPLEAAALDAETRSRLKQLTAVLRTASRDAANFAEAAALNMGDRAGEEAASMMELTQEATRRSRADSSRALSFLVVARSPEDEDTTQALVIDAVTALPRDLDAGGLVWQSHADFAEQIGILLTMLQTEWLSKYQDSLARFLEFYTTFSDIMETISPSASGDKGDVKIDFTQIHRKLTELSGDYATDVNALAAFSSHAAADAFKISLGLPGLSVTGPGTGGLYHVKMDLSAVKGLISSMENENSPGKPLPSTLIMDSARYNAWVSQKDSNTEQIKHVSKVLGEKLNEMTQKFDNVVKILSSSIDKMSDVNMSYARNT